MSLWRLLLGFPGSATEDAAENSARTPAQKTDKRPTPLSTEPGVFECRDCGKVFEARRRHPLCPECDSSDVELMSA